MVLCRRRGEDGSQPHQTDLVRRFGHAARFQKISQHIDVSAQNSINDGLEFLRQRATKEHFG